MVTQLGAAKRVNELVISWEALPKDFQLEDEPVENTGQPLLAGALRESLEISGFIQEKMLIASNFGLCVTLNGELIVKAPDWVYVASINEVIGERRSYTPNLEGEVPAVVMEFLSETQGEEYSVKRTYPPGKWFFYEQILQVPVYVIFDPDGGLLEYYQLENRRYELKQPDENGRHWMDSVGLYLGTWQGTKEARTGYWLRWWDGAGNLLPWAVEVIEQERQRAEQQQQRAEQQQQHAEQERQRAEQERQRAEQERQRAEQQQQRAEQERQRAEQQQQRAEQERQRAEQQQQRAEQERQQKERLIAYLQSQGIDPNNFAHRLAGSRNFLPPRSTASGWECLTVGCRLPYSSAQPPVSNSSRIGNDKIKRNTPKAVYMVTQLDATKRVSELVISWEALPEDFQLEDEPVENTGQPLLAGALRESLEISGFIQEKMLVASNFGLCATLNGELIVKAPDWVYIASVNEVIAERRSYTPNLEGEVPAVVMEFLSETQGEEYSVKRTYPPGKWFFYEQILQVPVYVIFDPDGGLLEYYQLENRRYELKQPDENGRHWMDSIGLYLGTWQGTKEARTGYWLRWWERSGNLLPWAVEVIEQERQRAEQERQRAEQERQRAEQERQRAEQERQRAEQERQQKERLIAYLQSQGIDPNNLPTD